jgi:NAD(P)-dependent dehydrogenase (short-subunit alcohol dehydrogenase family)
VTKDEDLVRVAAEAKASGGSLSGLVYAVGSIPLKPLKSSTANDFLEAYMLNTVGGALLVKYCAPQLTAGSQPGSVVLFSTVAARVGFPNHCAIAGAKGGVEALTRSIAAEYAPKLRVNCIAPSLSDTPLASRMTSNDAMRKALGDAHPIPRVGTATDSAALAEYLLDDVLSGWVTGQIFPVDGGRSTLRPKN